MRPRQQQPAAVDAPRAPEAGLHRRIPGLSIEKPAHDKAPAFLIWAWFKNLMLPGEDSSFERGRKPDRGGPSGSRSKGMRGTNYG